MILESNDNVYMRCCTYCRTTSANTAIWNRVELAPMVYTSYRYPHVFRTQTCAARLQHRGAMVLPVAPFGTSDPLMVQETVACRRLRNLRLFGTQIQTNSRTRTRWMSPGSANQNLRRQDCSRLQHKKLVWQAHPRMGAHHRSNNQGSCGLKAARPWSGAPNPGCANLNRPHSIALRESRRALHECNPERTYPLLPQSKKLPFNQNSPSVKTPHAI